MAEGEDEKSVVGSGDEAEKKESRSPTRSASYSPSPPKSPPRTRTSRSPVESRRADDVARQSPSPRSARARQSWSPDERVPDRREAHSVEVVGLTRVIGESHLDHIFAYYGSIDEIILPTIRMTGENRGKGWIVYQASSSARKAQDYMDGGQIDGAVISVRQAHVPEEEQRCGSRDYRDKTGYYASYERGSQRDGMNRDRRGGRGRGYGARGDHDDNRGGRRSTPLQREKESLGQSKSNEIA